MLLYDDLAWFSAACQCGATHMLFNQLFQGLFEKKGKPAGSILCLSAKHDYLPVAVVGRPSIPACNTWHFYRRRPWQPGPYRILHWDSCIWPAMPSLLHQGSALVCCGEKNRDHHSLYAEALQVLLY